jgi:hypothetical protein
VTWWWSVGASASPQAAAGHPDGPQGWVRHLVIRGGALSRQEPPTASEARIGKLPGTGYGCPQQKCCGQQEDTQRTPDCGLAHRREQSSPAEHCRPRKVPRRAPAMVFHRGDAPSRSPALRTSFPTRSAPPFASEARIGGFRGMGGVGVSPTKYCGQRKGARRAPTTVYRLVPPGDIVLRASGKVTEGHRTGLDASQNSDDLPEDGGIVAEDGREGRVVRH